LPLELSAHAFSGDLTGVQQVMTRVHPLAQASKGWQAYAELAEGYFQQLRGDLDLACVAFERCLALVSPGGNGIARILTIWPLAVAGRAEALVDLGRYVEARAGAEAALRACGELGIDFLSHDIARALALAEARMGELDTAAARLQAIIEAKTTQGVTGLGLGAVYEARARIAIWANDGAALDTYASLAAKEYRREHGSALGARWERLMAEARKALHGGASAGGDSRGTTGQTDYRTALLQRLHETMASASTAEERAQRAVKLLCEDRGARTGHLYLLGEKGLMLVASHGEAESPPGLLEFVRAYLGQAISEDSDSTAALTGTQVASLLTGGTQFLDASGRGYQPVLLSSVAAGGGPSHVGVAALGACDGKAPVGGASLVSGLSTYLVEAGDVRAPDEIVDRPAGVA
jgi:tetratricopeptide (TPR) repeat protein